MASDALAHGIADILVCAESWRTQHNHDEPPSPEWQTAQAAIRGLPYLIDAARYALESLEGCCGGHFPTTIAKLKTALEPMPKEHPTS